MVETCPLLGWVRPGHLKPWRSPDNGTASVWKCGWPKSSPQPQGVLGPSMTTTCSGKGSPKVLEMPAGTATHHCRSGPA